MLAAGLLMFAFALFSPLAVQARPTDISRSGFYSRNAHDNFFPPGPYRGPRLDRRDGADGQDASGQNGGIVINGAPFPPNASGTFSVGAITVTLEGGRVVSITSPNGNVRVGSRDVHAALRRGNANGGNAVGGNGGNGQNGQNSVGQNGGVSTGGGDADGDDNVAGVDIPPNTNGTFQIGGHTVVIENGRIVSVDGQPLGPSSPAAGDQNGANGQDGQNARGQDGQDGAATPGRPGVVVGSGSANGGSATAGKGGRGGHAGTVTPGKPGVVVGSGSAKGGSATAGTRRRATHGGVFARGVQTANGGAGGIGLNGGSANGGQGGTIEGPASGSVDFQSASGGNGGEAIGGGSANGGAGGVIGRSGSAD
ncbi:hypothetical protein C2E23DRAFT_856949 [Lenzites betulinus]|nr:hypothetical protein C2E23DRAFT_856949 [Lenzites betulinus]